MTSQTLPRTTAPALPADAAAAGEAGPRMPRRVLVARLARHYVEMVVAMVAGMVVFGAVVGLAAGALGLDHSDAAHPYLGALEMATTMSAGMALWMRFRRHHWQHVWEMTAAMYAPLVVLFPLARAGVLAPSGFMTWEHAVMLPLMLAVMLRKPHAYAGSH